MDLVVLPLPGERQEAEAKSRSREALFNTPFAGEGNSFRSLDVTGTCVEFLIVYLFSPFVDSVGAEELCWPGLVKRFGVTAGASKPMGKF